MKFAETLRRLLPGAWFGLLATLAFVVMPTAFRLLGTPAAGSLARAVFETEAFTSLVLGMLLLVIERKAALLRHASTGTSQFSAEMLLVLGALFCTVAGFSLQPLLEAARAGDPATSGFGRLHALSTGFFGLKGLLVLGLAWKATRSA